MVTPAMQAAFFVGSSRGDCIRGADVTRKPLCGGVTPLSPDGIAVRTGAVQRQVCILYPCSVTPPESGVNTDGAIYIAKVALDAGRNLWNTHLVEWMMSTGLGPL
jgi:hypothetical protein